MLPIDFTLPSPYVDLQYPLTGKSVPFNHGYLLYAAICRQFSVIHDLTTLSILPISGKPDFPKLLHLTEDSQLCLRLPSDRVPLIYRLAGKTLTLNEHKIRIGLPESRFIVSHSELYSRLVIIRGFSEPQSFIEAAQRQLDERNIAATLNLIARPDGEPIRRTIEIKGKTLIGYGITVTNLSEDDAISLQEKGLGGKQKMGCGVFVPVKSISKR